MKRKIYSLKMKASALALGGLILMGAFGETLHAQTLGDGIAAFSLQDYEQAHAIFLPLAENGDAEAAFRLGRMLESGYGTAPDQEAAKGWYEKAANAGHELARQKLSDLEGLQGQEANLKILEMEAAKGSPRAMIALARLYAAGNAVPLDKKKAHELLVEMCSITTSKAMIDYGRESLTRMDYEGDACR
ncbi:hypothetical protein JCM17846_29590 [Iodidimonas nitroreducens]|uniref:Sel1 repeat family protein n=1 Tax=Iodidimonas nitroreducens TaxID=1236968 RepID=A0A5A7NBH4_9PROT|nr:SEL1-like repeat protein [Iodidimonas nitroreducens]GER05277.1 hypothetical protein JCM17846_29590 [Iodidimonas nitroreducens]